MAPIKHFAAPAGLTTPPLSFATRTGDLLFISGIPEFDADGAIPDSWVEPLRNPSHVAMPRWVSLLPSLVELRRTRSLNPSYELHSP
jgi:hypothetical protein